MKRRTFLIYEIIVLSLMIAGIICYRPPVLTYISLLISMAVMFLQSKVNRYAFLIGALNSILYAVAYVKMQLYATALYALAFSCPLQLITFFNWNRYTNENRTRLREMLLKTRFKTLACIVGGFVLFYIIFRKMNSQYLFWDNCISILGIITSIICMLRFKEYIFLQILSNMVSLLTFITMLESDPSRIIWVVNCINAIISSCIAFKNMKLNKEPKK